MSRVFDNLAEEKRNHIILKCIEEFAKNGYENASTNKIVKNAGISKGTLFNYFGNKKELYFFLVDYAIGEFIKKSEEDKVVLSADLFERLQQRGMKKLKISMAEPLLYNLIYNSFVTLNDEMKNELKEKYSWMYEKSSENLYEGLDTSMFKDEVNPEKAIEIIQIFLDGFFQKKLPEFKNLTSEESLKQYEKINAECSDYFNELRKLFYK